MSWIFGVWDPGGASEAAVQSAATGLIVRGTPRLVGGGEIVLGALDTEAEFAGVITIGRTLVAADARVYAIGHDRIGVSGVEAAEALGDVVRTSGVDGLDHVAGDFAFARFDMDRRTLVLSRDPVGSRPLYWARRDGGQVVFASDPTFFDRLSRTVPTLDRGTVARFLAGGPTRPERSGIEGIRRVLGGHSVEFTEGGQSTKRWFRPERDQPRRWSFGYSAHVVEEAITAAVEDRAQGQRPGLWLSGGRDSGSLSIALARIGVEANCFTMTFDSAVCESEDGIAAPLAAACGHGWTPIPQPVGLRSGRLEQIPSLTGIPLAYPSAISAVADVDAVRRSGSTMIMHGLGGELFAAHPVSVLDLFRAGEFGSATKAAVAFDRRWVHPYDVQLKVAIRALAPRPLIAWREGLRPRPPWALPVQPIFDESKAPKSDRDYLVRFLQWVGGASGLGELTERLYRPAGITWTAPFFDRRVIRAAMSVPLAWRLPAPVPKPILGEAFLGEWEQTRVKADQSPWIRASAKHTVLDLQGYVSDDSEVIRAGLARPRGLGPSRQGRWDVEWLRLVTIESWLRRGAGWTRRTAW